MSNFITTLKFASSFLPGWVFSALIVVLGFVLVLVLLKIIKAILDAIPFV